MTGGHIVILGDAGQNFGAGMSGGIAYVLPSDVEQFKANCNMEMIEFGQIETKEEQEIVRNLIIEHLQSTESNKALDVLAAWEKFLPQFVKVVPTDYQVMLEKINRFKTKGLTDEQAAMEAFVSTTGNKELALSAK